MGTLTVRRTLDHPLESVWPVLADFAGTAVWNPDVLASAAVGDRRTGLGARRRCEFDTEGRKWTEEEIVAFDEGDHRYTLRIMEGTAAPPVEDVRVELAATAVGPRTEVVVTATLTGRTVGQRLAAGAGSVVLRRVFHRVLAGLALHLDTGLTVADRAALRAGGRR